MTIIVLGARGLIEENGSGFLKIPRSWTFPVHSPLILKAYHSDQPGLVAPWRNMLFLFRELWDLVCGAKNRHVGPISGPYTIPEPQPCKYINNCFVYVGFSYFPFKLLCSHKHCAFQNKHTTVWAHIPWYNVLPLRSVHFGICSYCPGWRGHASNDKILLFPLFWNAIPICFAQLGGEHRDNKTRSEILSARGRLVLQTSMTAAPKVDLLALNWSVMDRYQSAPGGWRPRASHD